MQLDARLPFNSAENAVLVLADGTVFTGVGLGKRGEAVAEICFNTSLTGYQEIMMDPSYAGQIITFTFPHIGNVGTNQEDIESRQAAAKGVILKAAITTPSNYRAAQPLSDWLTTQNLIGLSGIDTRALTRHIRDHGAPVGVIAHAEKMSDLDIPALQEKAKNWPGLEGMDLAKEVTCTAPYEWSETIWNIDHGHQKLQDPTYHVVAIDFGAKYNILRCLAGVGCRVTVVPATATAEDILSHNPDGIFLSNGPGDPAATGKYAIPEIQKLIASQKPIFGICLGHQILSLALGAKSYKLRQGHRGGNQPVKDLLTGKVEITSQNHGFAIDKNSLPDNVVESHVSLFDQVLEGISVKDKPVFSVQYHPEASPGPKDSHYLFQRFADLMAAHRKAA